jgi:CHAT domain-containing protein
VVCPYGFWGYRYIIEQIPCRVERDDPPKPALPMYVRNDLPVHLTALINPALQNWETHALHLAQLAPAADLVLEQRDTFEGILTALAQAQADIFYVYTHGGRDELGRACLKVNDGDFIVTDDLDAYQVMFTDMQPLIVLNACDSARYSPQDFENLLLYFCKHGAAGVVGAQCGVSELLVDSIMAPFLTEFLRQVPAGEALYRARCLLLTGQQPDPRGLVYSLFAAADLQIAQGIADA